MFLYVALYGLREPLKRQVQKYATLERVRDYLERTYLCAVTVADLTSIMYRLRQDRRSVRDYLADGQARWRLVGDLMPHQEGVVVAQWVSGLEDVWVRHNQAIFDKLRLCRTWDQLDTVVEGSERMINEEFLRATSRPEGRRREVRGTPNNDNNARPVVPVAAGAGGTLPVAPAAPATSTGSAEAGAEERRRSAARNDQRCYNCGELDHIARNCTATRQRYRNGRGAGQDSGNIWEGL